MNKNYNNIPIDLLYILLFLIIISGYTFAQTNEQLYWGVNIKTHLNFEKNSSTPVEYIPLSTYLHAGTKLNKYFQPELSLGYVFLTSTWDGIDISINFKSQFISRLFADLGYEYDSISGGGSHNDNESYNQKVFHYYVLGIGYLLNANSYVDVNYNLPANNNNTYGFNRNSNLPLELNGRLTLGVGWNFAF